MQLLLLLLAAEEPRDCCGPGIELIGLGVVETSDALKREAYPIRTILTRTFAWKIDAPMPVETKVRRRSSNTPLTTPPVD